MPTNSSTNAIRQITRAAGTVMAAFILSNIVGLIRQVLVAHAFGTGTQMDSFNAAITIPDVLYNLMAGGALASAFMPTFAGLLAKEDQPENQDEAWKLASAVTNLVSLALALASVVTAIFAPWLVRHVLFALDPTAAPATLSMTTNLLRIILIAPTIFSVSGLVMSILNAHQKFWLPALAPVFYWLGWIFGLLFFVPRMGIYGLAWGYVLGAFLHLAIQLPDLLKVTGRKYFPTLGIGNPAVGKVAQLMGPRLLGVAAVQLNFVINTMVAASLGEGSLSAIKTAFMLMTMPLYAIAQSIATAALPTFSAQVARGEIDEMRSALASTLRGILLLAIPATVGLILLRVPVVAMLFQRGAFNATSTELTAWALLWYTAGLVGHSIVEILSRAFYALHDTKTPVAVGTGAMILNALFSFIFPGLFAAAGWLPLGGLALANSLATALEAIILLWLIRRRLQGLNGADVLKGTAQFSGAALGMGLVLWFWIKAMGNLNPWLIGLGGVAAGGLAYAIGVVLLKVPEIQSVVGFVKRKL